MTPITSSSKVKIRVGGRPVRFKQHIEVQAAIETMFEVLLTDFK